MSAAERIRPFFGVTITPDFGLTAGVNLLLTRGIGITAGGVLMFANGAGADQIARRVERRLLDPRRRCA